jgi:integrase
MGSKRKYQPISLHKTLDGILQVNWKQEYQGEYYCPNCNQGKLTSFFYYKNCLCKVRFYCNFCGNYTFLSCEVPQYIFRYCPEIECPNPLCNQLGHNGQKGWIYQISDNTKTCKCYFCKVHFYPKSTSPHAWVANQQKNILHPFCFEDDIWDLRHFSKNPEIKTINFSNIKPKWYQLDVKKYLHFLLKTRVYEPRINHKTSALRHFGKIIEQRGLQKYTDIVRETILTFLDTQRNNNESTIYSKLSTVRDFLEWLGLDSVNLVRRRDFPKVRHNDTDWLDEVTRTAIKQHLHKIPAPIARHYLVQEYTAARPGDICSMKLDCLGEENGQWYIQFFQQKVNRWHRIPANREIRRVIEEQQQWIRDTFGNEYPYLFCHFRNIKAGAYPSFPNIKPLKKPPQVNIKSNPMVRIIRMLIDPENILDANGQKPHFTGKITRSSRLQEIRVKHGIEAAQLYADHKSSETTFQHYTPPSREEVAKVDLPFQELLLNPENRFLPWQSLPESLLKNPKTHELDMELSPRLVVYGHCTLDPKTPCIYNLYPKCYGCSSFRPSTGKLPLYERQYAGEQQRLKEAETTGTELAYEEAKTTIEAMDKWLDDLRRLNNGE